MADLLKDAIAEAKKVKATALANAKIALQETFQPTLQRMISSKIAEEEGDEELEPEVDDFGGEGEGLGEPAVGFGGAEELPAEEELPVEDPGLEGGDEFGEEDDLEEEINRLMAEMDNEYEDEAPVEEGNEEDWQDPIPDEPIQENDGELTEAEINEILGSLDEEEGCEEEEPMMEQDGAYDSSVSVKKSNTESLQRQNTKLKKDLNEAYRAITTLKGAMNEVNLLNAKLMYSQKVLQQYDLSQDQRIKVLEAFDRANTVKEVKGKYADMLSLLSGRKASATPKRKSVTEGIASKPIKQLNPKQPLNEDFSYVERWKELSGQKKLDY